MISKKEEAIIQESAKKYNVSSVFLFGSSLREKAAHDIDLAAKGIKPRFFFDFYADLFKGLSKSVDLVDLDEVDSYFAKRILDGGKIIYGA